MEGTRRMAGALLLLAAACGRAHDVRVTEAEPGLLDRARVEPTIAEEIARSAVPDGTIVAAEIEREEGRLVYSFDLTVESKDGVDEVLVDADTGEVLGVDHESAAEESQEEKRGP